MGTVTNTTRARLFSATLCKEMSSSSSVSSSGIIDWCTKCVPEEYKNSTLVEHFKVEARNFATDESSAAFVGFQVTAVLACIVGFILCFFGYSLFHLTLAITGFAVGLGAGFALLCGTGSILAAGIAGAVCGILLAVLVVKLEKMGVTLCGAAGGVAAYMYLNGFLLHMLYSALPEAHQSWTPAVMCSILALMGSILARYAEKHILIIGTAFGGAYCMGFGVDRLAFKDAHHNLNPVVLFSGNGCTSSHCYLALSAFICVGILGMMIQYHVSSKPRYDSRFSKVRNVEDYDVVYVDHQPLVLSSHHGKQIV